MNTWQSLATAPNRSCQAAMATSGRQGCPLGGRQGCPLGSKDSRVRSDEQRRAAEIRECRVKSGGRERSRKQREPTSSNNINEKEFRHKTGIRFCSEHIRETHMGNGKEGKSIFKATKLCEIWSLVYITLTYPNEEFKDRSKKDRLVVKKSFDTPIGVHGFTRAECYTVKVVYDQLKRRPITAYPTLP